MVCAVCCTSLAGCGLLFPLARGQGEPDRTDDYRLAINQDLSRGANWKQIVRDSPFQLGEKTVTDSWETESGSMVEFYERSYGSYPHIDGSTVSVPMGVEFARQHLGFSDEDAMGFCQFSTTHVAYEALIFKTSYSGGWLASEDVSMEQGKAIDLFIGTEPSDEELALAAEEGVELIKEPVCWDAFVFITHKDNPVESLTVDEIRGIYAGEITDWAQLGGKAGKIVPYQREKNSGSQTAMENLVMQGTEMLTPETVQVIEGMGGLVEAVAEYQNDDASIGYTYQYYIDTLYKNDNIKVLAVEGVSPQADNLRDGSYPFTTNYYGVIRSEDKGGVGGRFLDWMLSDEGQACIAQAGYIAKK